MAISIKKEAKCCKKEKKGKHRRKLFQPTRRRTVSESDIPSPIAVASTETPVVYENASSSSAELIVAAMLNSPFKKVCSLLQQLDVDRDNDLISETILHFSLVIYGLPECRSEDLPLAVYFFIEDTFGLPSKIELCVKLHEDGYRNVIGVVFETISMKYSVLKNDELLDGAEVRIMDNKDLNWIIDGFNVS